VLGGIVAEIFPEVRGQRVFVADRRHWSVCIVWFCRFRAILGVQDAVHLHFAQWRQVEIIPAEAGLFPETHHHNPLPVLGQEVFGIDDAGVELIAEFVFQCPADHFEGPALVVAFQVLDVLKQEGRRSVSFQVCGRHQRTACPGFHREAVRSAEGILLGNPGNREGLAGKAGQQHIMLRYVFCVDLCDVAFDRAVVAVIGLVGQLGVLVPFAGEYAASADFIESCTQAADACEEVDEGEGLRGGEECTSRARTSIHFRTKDFGFTSPDSQRNTVRGE
jgi:hypothetical protein